MMKRKPMLYLLYTAVAIVVALVAMSVQYAPIFTLNILVICTVIICYVLTEDWTTHDAIEFENRFWTLIAFILARACVFCPDSPLRVFEERRGLAWLTVILAAYGAHIYERHLRRLVLSRVPKIPRVKSSSYDLSSRVNARTKLAELRKLQDMLDNKYISSTFQNIFNLGKVLHIENQILEIFTESDKDELNLILSTAELGHIFYKVKDHKFVHRYHRTKLLETLAVDRLRELNITARTMLLDAFQKMKLTAHPKADIYVKNIITSTLGDQLSELKSLSDSKNDINSFHKLVYRDIENRDEKENILNHIKRQADIQEAHNKIGGRTAKQRGLLAWRKIMSDVDDTLTCSGGVWPAGIDTRYPRKAIYPGVLSFYRELDLGITGDDSWDENTRVGNLVFLSARPHLYREMSETHNYSKFRDLQEKRSLYTSPTLLTGSVKTGTTFIVGGSPEPLAVKKFENLTEYLTIYPEFSCILIGDNGQGDVRAAEMVMDDDNLCGNLTRSYIHVVQPVHQTHTLHQTTKQTNHAKICYFTNYIDAAIDAYNNKLIKLSGLRRIMRESIFDFDSIPKEAWDSTQDEGFAIGDTQRHTDDTEKNKLTTQKANAPLQRRKELIVVYNPELKVDARMRELNISLYHGNKILADHGISCVKLMRFRCRFPNGSLVKTFMGTGVVTRFRNCDGVYEVLLQWDKTGIKPPVKAFFQGSAMKYIPPPLNPSSTVRRFRGKAQPIVLRSAVTIVQLPNVSNAKKDVPSVSQTSSARSSPSTVSHEKSSKLTLAAVERHNIITGTRQMTDDAGNMTIKEFPAGEVPIEKALEMAFVPSALNRAPGRKLNRGISGATISGRARTVSTSSDDKLSSSMTGRVKDHSDRLCDSRGAIAWTPYGIGVVEDYRDNDDKVLVKLQWGAISYIGRLDVVQLTDPSETLSYQPKQGDNEEIDHEASLIHGNAKVPKLPPSIIDSDDILNETNSFDLYPDSAEQIASTVEKVQSKNRPSLFPSWVPFLGSSSKADDDVSSAPNEAQTVDSVIKRSIVVPEFDILDAHTIFGKAQIIQVWVSKYSSSEENVKANEVIIEVNFTNWKLSGNSEKCARGYLSANSFYVKNVTDKNVGNLAPIGEDVASFAGGPRLDENLLLFSSHPAFTRFMNQQL